MLEEIMNSLHNFFEVPGAAHYGVWVLENGQCDLPFLKPGQYYKIEGSIFNDGIHKYQEEPLEDETFVGWILPLAVPKAFLSLVDEIQKWQEKHGAEAAGPFQSETLPNAYSYTKATAKSGGTVDSWQTAFESRLTPWRKLP